MCGRRTRHISIRKWGLKYYVGLLDLCLSIGRCVGTVLVLDKELGEFVYDPFPMPNAGELTHARPGLLCRRRT